MLKLISENYDLVNIPMPRIITVPTRPEHIRELNKNLREGDRNEIESYGFSAAKGLWKSYKNGLMNQTAVVDGKVAACWGVGGTYMGSVAAPWLLTSYVVHDISPLQFARIYQKEVHKMLKMFPKLENYVLASYNEAVRLLQIVGFEIGEPEQLGNGIYRKFSMKAKV